MAKSKLVKGKLPVTVLELLEQKVNLGELLECVHLREEQLIEAALEQPTLVLTAGTFRVQRFHKRAMLETKLSLAKSSAGLKLRRIRDTGGKKEFTEGAVKERIEGNPRVVKIRKRLDRAYAEEELGKLLQEVFRTRSDSIRTIVNAGKVSVHAKELALLRGNKALARGVTKLRDRWNKEDSETED